MSKILVKVKPNARQTQLVGKDSDNRLIIRIAARATDGEANTALLIFLAGLIGTSISRLQLSKGAASIFKTIEAKDVSSEHISQLISEIPLIKS